MRKAFYPMAVLLAVLLLASCLGTPESVQELHVETDRVYRSGDVFLVSDWTAYVVMSDGEEVPLDIGKVEFSIKEGFIIRNTMSIIASYADAKVLVTIEVDGTGAGTGTEPSYDENLSLINRPCYIESHKPLDLSLFIYLHTSSDGRVTVISEDATPDRLSFHISYVLSDGTTGEEFLDGGMFTPSMTGTYVFTPIIDGVAWERAECTIEASVPAVGNESISITVSENLGDMPDIECYAASNASGDRIDITLLGLDDGLESEWYLDSVPAQPSAVSGNTYTFDGLETGYHTVAAILTRKGMPLAVASASVSFATGQGIEFIPGIE